MLGCSSITPLAQLQARQHAEGGTSSPEPACRDSSGGNKLPTPSSSCTPAMSCTSPAAAHPHPCSLPWALHTHQHFLTKDRAGPGVAQTRNTSQSPKGQEPSPEEALSTIRLWHRQAQAAGESSATTSAAAGHPGGGHSGQAPQPQQLPPPSPAKTRSSPQQLLPTSLCKELSRCSSTVSVQRLEGPSLHTPEAGLTHVRGD